MLSPPEGEGSHDKRALDDAGRERYLNSLERRLGKLEGGNGRRKQLTSRDMLQSLSEAREDHMQQFVSRSDAENGMTWGRVGGRPGEGGSGSESPFSIRNEFADVDLGEGGGSGDVEGEQWRVGGRRVGDVESGEERPATGGSVWTCCLCCKGGGRHRGYSRAQRSGDEEGSRLVDCDELSLEWQSQDINDIT